MTYRFQIEPESIPFKEGKEIILYRFQVYVTHREATFMNERIFNPRMTKEDLIAIRNEINKTIGE